MLDDLVPVHQRRVFIVDTNLKRDFSGNKLEIAKGRAFELISELPFSKKAIALYLKNTFGFELKDSVSFGLGVHGKKRELSLVVTFDDNTPVYRLSSSSDPDFVDGRVE